jgi:hypothetical protein
MVYTTFPGLDEGLANRKAEGERAINPQAELGEDGTGGERFPDMWGPSD